MFNIRVTAHNNRINLKSYWGNLLCGFHGNNHKPPHQISLLNFKNLMREVTINSEVSLLGLMLKINMLV